MAQVFDPSSGQWIEVPDDEVTALVGAGRAYLPKGKVPVVDARGVVGEVPAEDAPEAFANGYRYRTASEIRAEQQREEFEDRPIAAGVAGAARAVTLGGSDAFLTEIGAVRPETLRGLEDYNTEASVGGELLGTAGALLATGGSATPVVAAERAAARLGTAAAQRLGGRAVVRGAVQGGVEGGLQGLGRAVTDAAQERDPLTAQKAMASVMGGALFGAGAGALFGRAEDAFTAPARAAVAAEPLPTAGRPGASAADAGAPDLQVGPTPAAPAGGAGGPPPPPSATTAGAPPPEPLGDMAGAIASGGEAFARPVKAAIEANPGVFRRVFSALDIEMPDADEFVLRGLDVKKKGMNLLREKGLLKPAPAALRADPRFAAVKNQEDAARLIAAKLDESGNQVQSAASRLDALVTPEEQFDVPAFIAKAEQELVAPLARGTVDERRAAARLREDLAAIWEGLTTDAPVTPRKAGVYEIPLSELDDVPANPFDPGRMRKVGRMLDEGKETFPIKIEQGTDGLREAADGNHVLAVARERGLPRVRVEFVSDEAAAINPGRSRGSSVNPQAVAPMDSYPPRPPPGRASFAAVEEWKRRLDKSLRWDSATPNEVRDQLRQLRGLLNQTQEETAERVAKKVGSDVFQEWKKAKTLYGQMAELDDIATERLVDAKGANRLFSLTDNLAGMVGAVAGGGLNPAGLGLALGAALLNKWGRENLPFVMARAMANYDGNPGARKAAQALVNKLRGQGPDGGAAPVAPGPPPTTPSAPGGAAATPEVDAALMTMLRTAAQQGPREAWLAHTLLSGAEEYRAALERAGLANYAPEADAEGQRRAGTMSRAEQASADFDAKATAATKGLLRGTRPAVKPRKASDSMEKAEAAVRTAGDPEAAISATAERLADVGADAPGLASEMQATTQRAQAFLAEKAPRRPTSPMGDIPALRTPWKPPDVELAQWDAYLRAVEDPASVLEDAAGGRLTHEAVEALAAVYPDLLDDLRGRVLEQLSSHPSLLDYQQRLSLGMLLGMDLDESMTPAAIASIQDVIQQQPERPEARGSVTPTSVQRRLNAEYAPSDAIAARSA